MTLKDFQRLMPTTSQAEFNQLLIEDNLRAKVMGNCPDLMHHLASRLHKLAGEQGEPVTNFDISVVKMMDMY